MAHPDYSSSGRASKQICMHCWHRGQTHTPAANSKGRSDCRKSAPGARPTCRTSGSSATDCARVFVPRIVEISSAVPRSQNGARVHDDDLVTHVGDSAQIVGDHDDGHAELRLQIADQFQICAWIVASNAVVGSSAIKMSGSHAKAMAIMTRWRMPPGQFVRVLFDATLGVVDADQMDQLNRPIADRFALSIGVQPDRFIDLVADREHGFNGVIGSWNMMLIAHRRSAHLF